LRTSAVQKLQWQGPIIPASEFHPIRNLKTGETGFRHIRNDSDYLDKSVSFTHEGFAVAGGAGGNKVHVWDKERGDELLSLDHGSECRV
jgi:hypothetical protein